jgi:two-component system, response regulator PdtaR
MKALRIVLVEDDPMIGALLADVLKDMGHDVCAIEVTKEAAVAAATHHRPELVIADARLGDESGIAAIDEILLIRFVPHLFMTGNISRVKAVRPDAVILEKPFNESGLTLAIQRALGVAETPSRTEWA